MCSALSNIYILWRRLWFYDWFGSSIEIKAFPVRSDAFVLRQTMDVSPVVESDR